VSEIGWLDCAHGPDVGTPTDQKKARQEERRDAMEASHVKNGGQPMRGEVTIRACQEKTETVVNAIQFIEATINK
jgi:hypothetical protein